MKNTFLLFFLLIFWSKLWEIYVSWSLTKISWFRDAKNGRDHVKSWSRDFTVQALDSALFWYTANIFHINITCFLCVQIVPCTLLVMIGGITSIHVLQVKNYWKYHGLLLHEKVTYFACKRLNIFYGIITFFSSNFWTFFH